MKCPDCEHVVRPMEGSTQILAWYSCPKCDGFWAARMRDGQPVVDEGDTASEPRYAADANAAPPAVQR